MINVFMDSNIWLSLYSFSSDNLDQFMKLKDLIGHDVRIWLPEQVKNEVERNRENKIKITMEIFESWKFDIPNIVKGHALHDELTNIIRNLKNVHKDIVVQIKQDIADKKLHADNVIKEIYNLCTLIPNTSSLMEQAFIRNNVGDPPGKDRKYGDAIIWLSLLGDVPYGQDLFFIGADGDFQSVLDKNKFNQFLLDEWIESKASSLLFYRSLTEFFNKHLKDIHLDHERIAEQEKEELIYSLETSGNFAKTHIVVSSLSRYQDWTEEQINRIYQAVIDNPQVGWIQNDEDIAEFLSCLDEYRQKQIMSESGL